jgi:flagellar biosynthetic protein FliP
MNKKVILLALFFFFILSASVFAAPATSPAPDGISIKIGEGGNLTSSLQVFLLVAVLSVAPSIVIMFTCFTQVIIVLGLTRQGLGTMSLPPNQVMVGLALFISFYIMSPVITSVYDDAWKPYQAKTISFTEAAKIAEVPIKKFMLKNTYDQDLRVFLALKGDKVLPAKKEEISLLVTTPAFALSQIVKGFKMGLMIYMVFAFIDMIVGSVLMFMGMMMLPPQMISLPLKLLVFVLIGGFNIIVEIIMKSISI